MTMSDGLITANTVFMRPTVYDKTAGGLSTVRSHALLGLGLTLLILFTGTSPSLAQELKPSTGMAANTNSSSNNAKPVKTNITKPVWAELTPMQRQSLMPLSQSWDTGMSEAQKRKWLEISKNYPQLSSEDQLKLHSRMNEWIALSPQQRTEARLNFAKTKEISKQLSPEEKNAQWQTYQALSPEEKKKLAAKAAADRHIGAAPAVRPVAPQKLAALPPRPTRNNDTEQQPIPSKPVPAVSTDSRSTPEALPGPTITPKN